MEAFWSYEYVVAGIVSSVLCLVLIILDYIFGSYAHKLTEWEYPRTQEYFEFYHRMQKKWSWSGDFEIEKAWLWQFIFI